MELLFFITDGIDKDVQVSNRSWSLTFTGAMQDEEDDTEEQKEEEKKENEEKEECKEVSTEQSHVERPARPRALI